ncbi:MAG: hypothetical protein HQK54_06885 [Oligoflexales bacterium]|nr:hypothetical protein [Oligoflexales bacterium]
MNSNNGHQLTLAMIFLLGACGSSNGFNGTVEKDSKKNDPSVDVDKAESQDAGEKEEGKRSGDVTERVEEESVPKSQQNGSEAITPWISFDFGIKGEEGANKGRVLTIPPAPAIPTIPTIQYQPNYIPPYTSNGQTAGSTYPPVVTPPYNYSQGGTNPFVSNVFDSSRTAPYSTSSNNNSWSSLPSISNVFSGSGSPSSWFSGRPSGGPDGTGGGMFESAGGGQYKVNSSEYELMKKWNPSAMNDMGFKGPDATYSAQEIQAIRNNADKFVTTGNTTPQNLGDMGSRVVKGTCGVTGSPIVLDLDNKGISLTSVSEGVDFDLLAKGIVRTAWIRGDSALLVWDRFGNGQIKSGRELIGEATIVGKVKAKDGFDALYLFDRKENGGNQDGIIDKRDTIFKSLKVWVDRNHNGISEYSELKTLPEVKIRSLDIKGVRSKDRLTDRYGNDLSLQGSFTREDGSRGLSTDVYFRYEPSQM